MKKSLSPSISIFALRTRQEFFRSNLNYPFPQFKCNVNLWCRDWDREVWRWRSVCYDRPEPLLTCLQLAGALLTPPGLRDILYNLVTTAWLLYYTKQHRTTEYAGSHSLSIYSWLGSIIIPLVLRYEGGGSRESDPLIERWGCCCTTWWLWLSPSSSDKLSQKFKSPR